MFKPRERRQAETRTTDGTLSSLIHRNVKISNVALLEEVCTLCFPFSLSALSLPVEGRFLLPFQNFVSCYFNNDTRFVDEGYASENNTSVFFFAI